MSGAETATIVDCWNRIGVAGDQSCDKLVRHIHCRNCEVYAAAAQRNLQRPLEQSYRAEWAELLRQPLDAVQRERQSVLVFRLGREWVALPTAMCGAVAPSVRAWRVPHRNAAGLAGIVNIGGRLLPAIDLAVLLGVDLAEAAPAAGRHAFARILVVEWEGQQFALAVDEVHGILRHTADQLQAPAATINKGMERFLTGVLCEGALHIGCLDGNLIGHHMARTLR